MTVFPENYELIEDIKDKDPDLAAILLDGAWLRLLPFIHDLTRYYQHTLVHELKDQVWEDSKAGKIDKAVGEYVMQLLKNADRRVLQEYNEPQDLDPDEWQVEL
jgi:hypothetical protein